MARAEPNLRDDFTAPTKDVIARRVGYRCSLCRRGTVGPNADPSRANNIGVAAHITAASPGGPRYNSELTSDERRDARNGIWCCQNCAKLIDSDLRRFPIAALIELREQAERAANERLEVVENQAPALAAAETKVRDAAATILRGWRELFQFNQGQLVELDLREYRRDSAAATSPAWTLAQLAQGLKESRLFILRGEPGAGKTMTLLQIASMLSSDAAAPVPLIFPVSGWINSGRDLVGYAIDQLATHRVTADDVALLLRGGRLAFLLNGWNEASDEGLARAQIRLREFVRVNPGTPLLLSTRITQATPTLAGETSLDLQRLTPAKKAAVVRGSGLAEPEQFIAQLDANATLAEITDTPLFLAASIRLAASGGELPATRSRLLLRCVEELENSDEHRAMLEAAPCFGCHGRYLAELAAEMTRRGRTTLSVAEAEDLVATCNVRLRNSGHLPDTGNARAILAGLVRWHLLVLPPGGAGAFSFVHEQFQERFSADWLLGRLRDLTTANVPPEILRFQQDILNSPHWRMPLVFALEDLGTDDPVQGAQLVRWMMPVDLVAAAELAGAGGAPVWALVAAELGPALRRWYSRDPRSHRTCAIAGMIATGAADFADLLWPMLESEDDQIAFHLLGAWERFDMAALGPDWARRVVRLPTRRQEIILGELSRRPSRDDLAFIRDLAVNGVSTKVKHAALDSLILQRRYADALAAINSPSFGPWSDETYILLTRVPRSLVEPFVPRLSDALAQATDPTIRHGIIAALRWADVPAWLETAKRELSVVLAARRAVPPVEDPAQRGVNGALRTSLDMLLAEYADMIRAADTTWFYHWLAGDESGDLIWDRSFIQFLPRLPEDVLVRLATSVVQGRPTEYAVHDRVRALAEGGSERVAGVVLDAYLAADNAADQRPDLRFLLGELPIASLVASIVARAGAATDFAYRHALVNAVFFGREKVKPEPNPDQRATLRQLARATGDSIPPDCRFRPSVHADLARLLGRIGTAEDIPLITTWAQEEVARWDAIRAAQAAAQRTGGRRAMNQDRTWWGHIFAESLVALGGPAAEAELRDWLARGQFTEDAANGLVQLCRQEGLLPPPPPSHQRSLAIFPAAAFIPSAAVVSRADAIYAARTLPAGRPGCDAKRLGMSLASLNDARALELLLATPTPHSGYAVGEALHVLASFGTPLPGRAVADALEPFIAANENPHRIGGSDPWHGIVRCLAVMLASDAPGLAIDRMRRLPAERREGRNGRELFTILVGCSKPEASAYLVELSRTLPPAAPSWPELIEALGASEDPVCRTRILEMAVTPAIPHAQGEALRREFVHAAESDTAFVGALQAQLQAMDASARAIYIRALSELESEAAMLALLDLEDLRPIALILEQMVRGIALGQRPAGNLGALYLVPRAANRVRRRLAEILLGESRPHRAIAACVLATIQVHRLEYGQPMDEPLHPDAALIPRLVGPWSLMS